MGPIPYPVLQEWKQFVRTADDPFIRFIPKIELHLHIEGTLTPSLRFQLAQKHNLLPLYSARLNRSFHTLAELQSAYDLLQPRSIKGANQVSAFFEAYYGGMEVLRDEEDFYQLAMAYFRRAGEMGVRYAEPSFDVQAHTRRGVDMGTVMRGFKRAHVDAERLFGVPPLLSYLSPRTLSSLYYDQSQRVHLDKLISAGQVPMDHVHASRPLPRVCNGALPPHAALPHLHRWHRTR